MGYTMAEKILGHHAGRQVRPGDLVDVEIDARLARDFGGANVVKNLTDHQLTVADPERTFFTFDCNPGGSDQKYARNQHLCRLFAREHGIPVFDIDQGIGTHVAMDRGLVAPGETMVSTDSHANIVGAIGAFGQGMGDQDIAYAFSFGRVWFKVPPTVKVEFKGQPGPHAHAKDIGLALLRHFGANGLLGMAAEFCGPLLEKLDMDSRITISSLATEMGAIIAFFPPDQAICDHFSGLRGTPITPVYADPDAEYARHEVIDLEGLGPLISRPGHPEDVVPIEAVEGQKIDSAFIGSCTNGRLRDLSSAAEILRGTHVAPGVVLKIVPSTDVIWRTALKRELVDVFKSAGCLLGNAGCAGCAAGQIGQNGPGEITISTGNRNFAGKQGQGSVYLASPAVVAASAVAGQISHPARIPEKPAIFQATPSNDQRETRVQGSTDPKPTLLRGRAWVIPKDNIDTDMIFHNRHLAITEISEMGPYAFGNLTGWEHFAREARPGDVVITGKNFGCGSSRQQAVDCFKALGTSCIIAESFGAIYERNAINSGFPILCCDLLEEFAHGQEIEVNLETSEICNLTTGKVYHANPFSDIQMQTYQHGGLLRIERS